MKIYKIFDDAMRFKSFHLDNEAYLEMLDPHIGEQAAMQFSQNNRPLVDFWRTLPVSLTANEGSTNMMPDLGLWRGGSLVLSPRAITVLKPMLTALGEFLPLSLDGDTGYALFNCLTEVAPDTALSTRVEEGGYFMDVDALVFSENLDTFIFKSPFENNRSLFCSGAFKDQIELHGLGGIYLGENLTDFS